MKKLFFMMIVAGALVACDNSGSNDANKDSSANGSGDTSGAVPPTPVITPDTANGANIDTARGTTGSTTTGTTADSTKK